MPRPQSSVRAHCYDTEIDAARIVQAVGPAMGAPLTWHAATFPARPLKPATRHGAATAIEVERARTFLSFDWYYYTLLPKHTLR